MRNKKYLYISSTSIGLLLTCIFLPVQAQTPLNAPNVDLQLPGEVQSVEVDEGQLRQYAKEGDFARVDAEVRRLQLLYPEWVPPSDLYGEPPEDPLNSEIDLGYLWAVYETGDMRAVEDEIDILKRLNSGWQPPAELQRQVRATKIRQRFKSASEAKDWSSIINVYQANPGAFACSDIMIESIWWAADAFAQTSQPAKAKEIYGRVLNECRAPDLRLSTLEKAMSQMSDDDLESLFQQEEAKYRGQEQEARFSAIKKNWKGDPTSRQQAQHSQRFGNALLAASKGDLEYAELTWLGEQIEAQRDENGAMVLGWHFFAKEDWAVAVQWFELSMNFKANANAAEGLAMGYEKLGRAEDAERIAAAWAGRVETLDHMLQGVRLQRVWDAINDYRPGEALRLTKQLLEANADDFAAQMGQGWALLALDRSSEARVLFEGILGNRQAAEEWQEQAAHGIAIAAVAQDDLTAARQMMIDYTFGFDAVDDIEEALVRQEATHAFNLGAYEEAFVLLRELKSRWSDGYQLDEIEGWTLYYLGRYEEALQVFKTVEQASQSETAHAGVTAAQLQLVGFN